MRIDSEKCPYISIIIPAYNAEQYIDRCIESVIKQTYDNIEIILIDDGSTDSSYKKMKKYEIEDPRVRLFQQKNKGVSAARNLGIKEARGYWISFVDADDYLKLDSFENICRYIEKETKKVELVCYSYIVDQDSNLCYLDNTGNKEICDTEDMYQYIFDNPNIRGFVWNKMFRKDIVEKEAIQFHQNIPMNEDLLFCTQYIKKINKGMVIDIPYYYYFKHYGSVSRTPISEKHLLLEKAFKIMYNECSNETRKKYVQKCYIEMIIFLHKKAIQYGCENKEIKKRLKHMLKSEIEIPHIELSTDSKRWSWLFKNFSFMYWLLRCK